MKRSVIVLALLLVLGITGTCFAHTSVNAARDQVSFTETVVYGDRAAADGLRIETGANYDSHLHWDSATTFTADSHTTQTDYHFTYAPEQIIRVSDPNGLSMSTLNEHYLDLDAQENTLSGLALAYRELYDATKPGEQGEMTIDLADYYDYYPLSIMLELPGFWFSGSFEHDYILDDPDLTNVSAGPEFWDEQELLKTFHDFFRIPVPKNQLYTIHISRPMNSHGGLGYGGGWGASDSAPTQEIYYLSSTSALTDDACYFTIAGCTDEGTPVDTSLIPGGFGIYKLPFTQHEDKATEVHSEDLATVYPFEPTREVLWLETACNDTVLMLLTRDAETACTLTSIDIATMETIQTHTFDYGGAVWNVRDFEDFLYLSLSDSSFLLLELYADGTFAERIHAQQLPEELTHKYYYTLNYSAMDWNGEQFAFTYWLTDADAHRETCGFYLMVYDETGLLYCGEYESSLTPWFDPQGYSSRYCSADGSRGITVSWDTEQN